MSNVFASLFVECGGLPRAICERRRLSHFTCLHALLVELQLPGNRHCVADVIFLPMPHVSTYRFWQGAGPMIEGGIAVKLGHHFSLVILVTVSHIKFPR